MPVLYVDGIAYAGDATNIEMIQAANIQQIIFLNLNSFFAFHQAIPPFLSLIPPKSSFLLHL